MQTRSRVQKGHYRKARGLRTGLRLGIEPPRTEDVFTFRSKRVASPRGTHLGLVHKCVKNSRRVVGDWGTVIKEPKHAKNQPIFNHTADSPDCTTNRRSSYWT